MSMDSWRFLFYIFILLFFLSVSMSVDVIIFYWISYNILLYLLMRAILLILLAVSLSNAYLINDTKATDTKNSTKPRRRSTTPYLAGSYEVAQIGGMVAKEKITFEIRAKKIKFKGCNTVSASYTFKRKTNKWNVSNFVSTEIACPESLDQKITQALKNTQLVKKKDQFVIFYNQKGQQVLKLKQGRRYYPVGIPITQGTYQVLRAYKTQIVKDIIIVLDDKNVGFRGCNIGGGPYKYQVKTRRWSAGPIRQTLRACPPDSQDQLIVKALQSADVAFKRNQISKKPQDRKQLIIFQLDGKEVLKAVLISANVTDLRASRSSKL